MYHNVETTGEGTLSDVVALEWSSQQSSWVL